MIGRTMAAVGSGWLLLATMGCGGSETTAVVPPTLAVTQATVQSALDLFTTGTVGVPATCAGSVLIDCPGGNPGSPVPISLTRTASSIVQTGPGAFTYVVQLSVASQADIPVTISGVECGAAVNTAAGASPTVQIAGTAIFSSQTLGGPVDRLDLTQGLTGLETADVALNGGSACQLLNAGVALSAGLLTSAFSSAASHLCASSGAHMFVACA